MTSHFTSIKFRNYKAFRNYTVSFSDFNILVGANNAGKSTVIGAFRILAEGIRKAQARKAEYSDAIALRCYGYFVNLKDLPVSTENIFTNYDDSEPAVVEFKISNGNKLKLIFPEQDICFLVCETAGRPIRTPSEFNKAYDLSVSFVPVLGPVEHNEELNLKETARRALLTHRASRNFRNIWYHFPENFESFKRMIQETWPGMDIQIPEVVRDSDSAKLYMFCPEERVPRELFWAGFGFQVWCQMLTFISKAPTGSLLIIDEPDIYLHSDLQRQLVHLLRTRDGDVLIATHSTEILAEAESGEILVLNKKGQTAHRIQNPSQLQSLFGALGSNLNPMLTQLAKTKRVLFVEGDDFSLLSAFARKLGLNSLANRSSFAVVPAKGFNPSRVNDFTDGMEATLGVNIKRAVIFDRDYRSEATVNALKLDFDKTCVFAEIHNRKELENFLLVPIALERAIRGRIKEKQARGSSVLEFKDDIGEILEAVTSGVKSEVFGQYNAAGVKDLCSANKGMDPATASTTIHKEVEARWAVIEERLKLVPGKLLIAKINIFLQEKYGVTVTTNAVVSSMSVADVPVEMKNLMLSLETFTKS